MVFRFGTFELDPVLGALRHDGLRVRLSDKPFRLLNLLVECPGQIVNHEQIRQRLWGSDTFVDFEGNVSVILAKLRQVLGDSPDKPLFIETVPRRGYRFVAPVTSIERASDVQSLAGNAGAKGLQEPQPVMVVGRGSSLFRSRRAFVLAALLILGTATLGITYFWSLRHSVDAAHASHNVIILVTPFENLSGDPSQEYLSDGLTEEMITQLGENAPKQLSVIARSTALRYKGSHKTVEEIGNEQNVDYILEGSLRRQGDIVRVTAQLFKVRRKGSLWAKAYERDGTDILSVQRDVAYRITDSLSVELLPSVRKPSTGLIAINPEAYDAYLKGLFEYNKRTEGGLRRSIQYFRQAIERDPNFGAGYAALAYSYATAASWSFLSPEDAYPNARQAAQKALSIDDTIADAHFATGAILHEYDWDWSGAEKEYQRGLQLNPSSATGHRLYAEYLTHAGRYSDALAELHAAQRLDPLSMITNSLVCYVYVHARQYDNAITECKKALELDPNFGPAHSFLGEAYYGKHLYDKAVLEHLTARDISGHVSTTVGVAALAGDYAASGKKQEAKKLLGELLQRSKRNYVSAYALARVYASLGDREQARQALERAFEQRPFELLHLADDPIFDPVRNELWFKQMIVKRGFPNSANNGASAAPQPPAMH